MVVTLKQHLFPSEIELRRNATLDKPSKKIPATLWLDKRDHDPEYIWLGVPTGITSEAYNGVNKGKNTTFACLDRKEVIALKRELV